MTDPVPLGIGHDDAFAHVVAAEMSRITTGRYRTTRRGAHVRDRDETADDRPFWAGVEFFPTTVAPGPTLRTVLRVGADPVLVGYRIHLPSAVERWNLRIGIVDAASRPALFASELCWYLVVQVGAADLDGTAADADGIRWINAPTEVFGRIDVRSRHVPPGSRARS